MTEMVKNKAAMETILKDLFQNADDRKSEILVELINFIIRVRRFRA
jgi:hypothetical protein